MFTKQVLKSQVWLPLSRNFPPLGRDTQAKEQSQATWQVLHRDGGGSWGHWPANSSKNSTSLIAPSPAYSALPERSPEAFTLLWLQIPLNPLKAMDPLLSNMHPLTHVHTHEHTCLCIHPHVHAHTQEPAHAAWFQGPLLRICYEFQDSRALNQATLLSMDVFILFIFEPGKCITYIFKNLRSI